MSNRRNSSPPSTSTTSTSDDALRGPFRIHVVTELTGVPEPTLRAWERRYGIPTPERTATGYRLYGPRDVEQVRELKRLCEGGMAAAEAAKLLLTRRDVPEASDSDVSLVSADPYAVSVDALLDAVLAFDTDALEEQLRRLTFLGTTSVLVDRVLTPVLHEIGRRWHDGELSIAQEHFASQRLSTLLRDLVRLLPGAEGDRRVVLASFADDEHELGLLGTAVRFSGWGLRPVFLGARTPPGAVRSAVASVTPVFVALSVTIAPNRSRARELVDDYGNACAEVPWVVGGAAAAAIGDLVRSQGGHIAPDDPALLRELVDELVRRSTLEPGAAKRRPNAGRKTP